jgi:hypothetical protein
MTDLPKHPLNEEEIQRALAELRKHMKEVVIPEIVEIMWQRQQAAAKSRLVFIRC